MIESHSIIKHAVEFQNCLMDWYQKEARDLPWRTDSSPYKVWISEIMLQQTRVDTVIPYFIRFISEISTVQELAQVPEEKLLKLWQGLGYYNRALNLKKAAQIIIKEFNGQIPSDIKDLLSLPGIGEYTAGAIASIAFGKAVPAVDGNVLRVIARLTAHRGDISDSKGKKQIESVVMDILPSEKTGMFNQALMDLGAMICLPNGEPKCSQCPVKEYCMAYRQGLTSEIPMKKEKKVRRIEKKTVLLLCFNGKYALQKRKEGGLLPNLWEFPSFEGHLTKEQCISSLKELGMIPKEVKRLKASKHIFSHLEWHMKGFFVFVSEIPDSLEFIWATKEEIEHKYSIPTAFQDFIKSMSL